MTSSCWSPKRATRAALRNPPRVFDRSRTGVCESLPGRSDRANPVGGAVKEQRPLPPVTPPPRSARSLPLLLVEVHPVSNQRVNDGGRARPQPPALGADAPLSVLVGVAFGESDGADSDRFVSGHGRTDFVAADHSSVASRPSLVPVDSSDGSESLGFWASDSGSSAGPMGDSGVDMLLGYPAPVG